MPNNEWIPDLCVAWDEDSDTNGIMDYNNRVVANYYSKKGRQTQKQIIESQRAQIQRAASKR